MGRPFLGGGRNGAALATAQEIWEAFKELAGGALLGRSEAPLPAPPAPGYCCPIRVKDKGAASLAAAANTGGRVQREARHPLASAVDTAAADPGPALFLPETSLSKSQQLPIFRPPDSHNCSARTASERPRPPSRPRPGGGSDRGTQTRLAIRASGAVRVASMNPVGGPGEDWPRGVNKESSYCSRAARMMEGCEKRRLAGRFARDDDEASPARTAALC